MTVTTRILTMALLLLPLAAVASDLQDKLAAHARSQFPAWVGAPLLVESVRDQNRRHARLGRADLIGLDNRWRAELRVGGGPLMDATLNNPLAEYLRQVQTMSDGLYTEIFVMDEHGLNVAASDVTSDYWQGDEAKYLAIREAGPHAVYVGRVEQDASTQLFQVQVSVPVVDGSRVIGVVAVGVDAGRLRAAP